MTANCRSRNTANSGASFVTRLAGVGVLCLVVAGGASPQSAQAAEQKADGGANTAPAAGSIALPSDYVIGADDVLSVLFWRDKDMSTDVTVRPDGKITLPLVNEIQASGLTPDQLRDRISAGAAKYIADPNVTVVVKQINSRKVFITGMVARPGAYQLNKPTTVLQLISMAGGLLEFAKGKEIVIARNANGEQHALKFNYKDVLQGKNLAQNVSLKPGDTVLVP
jgi:polysaccharide export outer membrane protein